MALNNRNPIASLLDSTRQAFANRLPRNVYFRATRLFSPRYDVINITDTANLTPKPNDYYFNRDFFGLSFFYTPQVTPPTPAQHGRRISLFGKFVRLVTGGYVTLDFDS